MTHMWTNALYGHGRVELDMMRKVNDKKNIKNYNNLHVHIQVLGNKNRKIYIRIGTPNFFTICRLLLISCYDIAE